MNDLSQLILLFNQLNPLFIKIQTDLTRLGEPTLTGLRLKSDYKQQNATLVSRIKDKASHNLQSIGFQARANSMKDILEDPTFKAWAETQEKQIEANDIIIEKINSYINDINNIFIGIFGDEYKKHV